jgi:hypothetical protein
MNAFLELYYFDSHILYDEFRDIFISAFFLSSTNLSSLYQFANCILGVQLFFLVFRFGSPQSKESVLSLNRPSMVLNKWLVSEALVYFFAWCTVHLLLAKSYSLPSGTLVV